MDMYFSYIVNKKKIIICYPFIIIREICLKYMDARLINPLIVIIISNIGYCPFRGNAP